MGTPVSGPGPYSRRTDMGQKQYDIPNADYGEQKAYQAQQSGAPMANSGGMDFASIFGNAADRVIPMGQESGQPGTPVTDGAALGMGAGVEAMGFGNPNQQSAAQMASWLPALEMMANSPASSAAARAAIRRAKGQV